MKKTVEAILFAKNAGATVHEIKALTGLQTKEIKKILLQLKEEYKDRGVIVVNNERLWKMTLRPELLEVVKDIVPIEMSQSYLKTLSIIAWKTPIKQSIVVKIRGNKAYAHVKRLTNRGFVSYKKVGRTKLLSITLKFHEYFKLKKTKAKEVFGEIKDAEIKKKEVKEITEIQDFRTK